MSSSDSGKGRNLPSNGKCVNCSTMEPSYVGRENSFLYRGSTVWAALIVGGQGVIPLHTNTNTHTHKKTSWCLMYLVHLSSSPRDIPGVSPPCSGRACALRDWRGPSRSCPRPLSRKSRTSRTEEPVWEEQEVILFRPLADLANLGHISTVSLANVHGLEHQVHGNGVFQLFTLDAVHEETDSQGGRIECACNANFCKIKQFQASFQLRWPREKKRKSQFN